MIRQFLHGNGREFPFHAAAVDNDIRCCVGAGDRSDLHPLRVCVLREQRHIRARADEAHVHAACSAHERIDPIMRMAVCAEPRFPFVADAAVRQIEDVRLIARQEEQEALVSPCHLNGDTLRRPFVIPRRLRIRNVPDIEFKNDARASGNVCGENKLCRA